MFRIKKNNHSIRISWIKQNTQSKILVFNLQTTIGRDLSFISVEANPCQEIFQNVYKKLFTSVR